MYYRVVHDLVGHAAMQTGPIFDPKFDEKRSILTEKVSRRGYHLSHEYAVDPPEILFVRQVMRSKLVALPASASVGDLRRM